MELREITRNPDHRANIIYMFGFVALAFVLGLLIYGRLGYFPRSISLFDFLLLSLATFRLVRLFTYDHVTLFIRNYFADPMPGMRKSAGDLLNCPWCFGVWAGTFVVFFYYTTPMAWYALLVLAISGVGSFIQLVSNQIGWRAEKLKMEASALSAAVKQ